MIKIPENNTDRSLAIVEEACRHATVLRSLVMVEDVCHAAAVRIARHGLNGDTKKLLRGVRELLAITIASWNETAWLEDSKEHDDP